MAACGRGWHLFNHGPHAVLADWLAWPLVGGEAEVLMAGVRAAFGDASVQVATWAAARSRIAEDWLAASGANQYVVLGAGLDSFAWRQDGSVRVLEVDHPATQASKRSRLEALAISVPVELGWVPVDFEVEAIADGLERSDLGSGPTFISWLGVTPYLSLDAIGATLRGLPACSLAVTYATPEDTWQGEGRRVSETFTAMALQAGEPPVSFSDPGPIRRRIGRQRFCGRRGYWSQGRRGPLRPSGTQRRKRTDRPGHEGRLSVWPALFVDAAAPAVGSRQLLSGPGETTTTDIRWPSTVAQLAIQRCPAPPSHLCFVGSRRESDPPVSLRNARTSRGPWPPRCCLAGWKR
jgi:methyltransferase (TIGR00027 family)